MSSTKQTRLLLAFYWLARSSGMTPCTAWHYATRRANRTNQTTGHKATN